MDRADRLVRAFMFLIKSETYALNHAALVLQAELSRGEDSDHTVMWEAVYGMVSHAANLSRVFWPAARAGTSAEIRRELTTRGDALRAAFDVGDDSPLRSRAVRDGFEHIDEALHDWMTEQRAPSMVDQFIGPAAELAEHSDKYIFRSFDPESSLVRVGDRSVALIPLSREADRIYDRWRELSGRPPHPTS